MFATMRFLLTIVSLLPVVAAAQYPAALPIQLSARMYETPLIGRAEILRQYQSQGAAAGDSLADQSVVAISRNASFQLTVESVDASGSRQTITGSPRLRYEHSGCFTVGSSGLITVTASNSSCFVSSAFNTLFVILLDEGQQQVVGWNSYNFKIQ
jgi:hypothetical protein